MPELRAVLDTLAATPAAQARAFSLLNAPRAVVGLRAVTEDQARSEELHEWMPSAGELWRALRVRRGLASRQVSDALRVHPARVTKWEKGTAAPPGELVATLLDLLHARPDERTILY